MAEVNRMQRADYLHLASLNTITLWPERLLDISIRRYEQGETARARDYFTPQALGAKGGVLDRASRVVQNGLPMGKGRPENRRLPNS
jgi:hypothetical protein